MHLEAETTPMRASGRRARADALSVQVRWGERRLFTQLLCGEGERQCLVGPTGTEGVSRVALEWEPSGSRLVFRDGVRGEVRRDGEAPRSLSQVVRDGLAEEKDGAWELALGSGDQVCVRLGHLTVEALPATAPRRVGAEGREPDYRFLNILLGTLLAAALAVVSAVVDDGGGALDDELTGGGARSRPVLFRPAPKLPPMRAAPVERPREPPQRRVAEAGRPRPPSTRPSDGGGRPDARATARQALAGLGVGQLLAGGGLGDDLHRAVGRMVGASDGLGGWALRGDGLGGEVGGPQGIGRIGPLHGGPVGEPRLRKGGPPTVEVEPGPSFTCDAAAHECLDKDTIRRVIRGHVGELRYCYESLLNRFPGLGGKVTVRFAVAPSGDVPKAEVTESTAATPELGACVASRVRTWRFPVPVRSPGYLVSYPFVFKTSGE